MHNIQITNGTGFGTDTKIFLDGKELEGVISLSYDISAGDLGRVHLEFYVDSININTEAEVIKNKVEKIKEKVSRFELMEI